MTCCGKQTIQGSTAATQNAIQTLFLKLHSYILKFLHSFRKPNPQFIAVKNCIDEDVFTSIHRGCADPICILEVKVGSASKPSKANSQNQLWIDRIVSGIMCLDEVRCHHWSKQIQELKKRLMGHSVGFVKGLFMYKLCNMLVPVESLMTPLDLPFFHAHCKKQEEER